MKSVTFILALGLLCLSITVRAQSKVLAPDLSQIENQDNWTLHNRKATYKNGEVHLDAKADDGVLWLKKLSFANGRIELDIKGKDERGRSFVGMAFHGLNETTYDVVYFRPFNFQSAEKSGNSVQYVSLPDFTWNRLREENSGVYENAVTPVPDPDDWFHVAIELEHPLVKVFVNNSAEPSLTINQLSSRKSGWLGFWVGNGSEGSFRNLKITTK